MTTKIFTMQEQTKFKIIDTEKTNFNYGEIVIIWHKIDETKAIFKSIERNFIDILTFKGVETLEKI